VDNQKYSNRKLNPQALNTSYADVVRGTCDVDTVYFRGPKDPLSNLYPCNIGVDGHNFKSSEAAYQFFKVMTVAESANSPRTRSKYWYRAKQIKNTTNSWKAMDLGKIPTNDTWKNMKIDVMRAILTEKYAQCPTYRNSLQNTVGKDIKENTGHPFWGRGQYDGGLNVLGSLHISIRDTYKGQAPTPYQQRIPGSFH
jgi:ribA/ribD-fused uncharacterized protein